MIGATIAVLTARLAAGSLLVAGIIHAAHRVPEGYLRLVARGAALAMALGLLAGRSRPEAPFWALLLAGAILLAFTVPRFGARPRTLAGCMVGIGFLGALLPPLQAPDLPGLALAANLSGGALLGGVVATMLLGHWYLVETSLSIRPLSVGSSLFSGAVALRIGVVIIALIYGGVAALRIADLSDLIYSTPALFFGFRVLTGLLFPAFLAVMIRNTVRIRSTQSATGLLYVALILVLFGELTAAFLEVATGGRLV